MDVISSFAARYERTREEELSLEDYLAECKRSPLAYATAAERMGAAPPMPVCLPQSSKIFPGLKMFRGSSARLIVRMPRRLISSSSWRAMRRPSSMR